MIESREGKITSMIESRDAKNPTSIGKQVRRRRLTPMGRRTRRARFDAMTETLLTLIADGREEEQRDERSIWENPKCFPPDWSLPHFFLIYILRAQARRPAWIPTHRMRTFLPYISRMPAMRLPPSVTIRAI